jgi:hypothetical protein
MPGSEEIRTKAIEYDAGRLVFQPSAGKIHIDAKFLWHGWSDASLVVSVREASNNAICVAGVDERGFGCKSGHVHERLLLKDGRPLHTDIAHMRQDCGRSTSARDTPREGRMAPGWPGDAARVAPARCLGPPSA